MELERAAAGAEPCCPVLRHPCQTTDTQTPAEFRWNGNGLRRGVGDLRVDIIA